MGGMKQINIASLVCRNENCPFWRKKENEHCRSTLPVKEHWKKRYCDKQQKEEEEKEGV